MPRSRDTDAYVALDLRTARANAFHADLFLSIHCNASESGDARGVESFVLDAHKEENRANSRIAMLEQDLAGKAGNIEQRRIKIREEVSGIKVGARKDLDRFVEETIRQLPNVIDAAKQEDLKQYLPAFLEDTFRKWAEAEAKEIGQKLEDLAERTIALVREDDTGDLFAVYMNESMELQIVKYVAK